MENHVKQFQYTSNSWMQALLYLRNYSDLIQSKIWFKYHFMKSLILAQDERWRRA